mmetsp:Transcript_19661/g.27428  ORF Transcript_19661/g.27428 Transcript_19661/m.27428 type:complete len:145 (+) Transcript_19661:187-621(+)
MTPACRDTRTLWSVCFSENTHCTVAITIMFSLHQLSGFQTKFSKVFENYSSNKTRFYSTNEAHEKDEIAKLANRVKELEINQLELKNMIANISQREQLRLQQNAGRTKKLLFLLSVPIIVALGANTVFIKMHLDAQPKQDNSAK